MQDVSEWVEQIQRLYKQQLVEKDAGYLAAHSRTVGSIRRQVETAAWYMPYVGSRVLDWGCAHAVDACLVRMAYGSSVELHGCDIHVSSSFPVFHQFAGLQYAELNHPYRIPYPDDTFDTVIASGALEHVPNDSQSLMELYRILKEDGTLILTFLPNAWSAAEWLGWVGGLPHHVRLYSLRATRSMLLHHGFVVLRQGYKQLMPTLSGWAENVGPSMVTLSNWLWKFNPLFERTWPIRMLCSNLMFVAQKRRQIMWRPKPAVLPSNVHPVKHAA